MAFSPDGQWLASGGHDTTVKLWDVATGRPTRTLEGHESLVVDLAFSPDGTRLASSSYDKTVRLWDVATGRLISSIALRKLAAHARVQPRRHPARDRRAGTGRSSCGTPVTGEFIRSVRGQYGSGGRPGLHPGREAARLDQHGWNGEALGRRDRPGSPGASRSHQRGLQPGLHP